MIKNESIFKTIREYFGSHPTAVFAWLWVAIMPALGSLLLVANTSIAAGFSIVGLLDHVIFTLVLAILLGLALLPTTPAALATGYYLGWLGFPGLFFGYLLANVVGYLLGKALNADFLGLLYQRKPAIRQRIEDKIHHPESLIFFVRISPVIPFAISNFLFASLSIDLKKILLFGVAGMLPRTLIAFATGMLASSLLDARNAMNDPKQWAVLGLLLVVSVWGLFRTWKKSNA